MADDIPIVISDRISAAIEQKLRAIGTAARSAHSDIETLKASLRTFSPAAVFKQAAAGIGTYNQALASATRNTRQLNTVNGQTATSLNRVRAAATSGAAALNRYGAAGRAAGAAIGNARSQVSQFLQVAGAVVGVQQFVDLADSATIVANKIKTVSSSVADFNRTQGELYELANRTRTSVESVADAYVRYAKVLLPLGKTQAEVLQFTETLTKAFRAAGKTAGEASSGVTQLGQALQKGRLDGDELRSVLENMPIEVTNALAKSLNASVGELRDLGAEGKITRDVLYNAISSVGPQIENLFARTTGTIGDALTVLRNNTIRFFSEQSEAAGVFSKAILFIADNINYLIPIVIAFGAAWGVVKIVEITASFFALAGAIVAATAPTVTFTLALVAAVGILATMAELLARLTGQYEQWKGWLDGVTQSIADNISGLIKTAQSAIGLDQVNAKAAALEANFQAAATAANATATGVRTIAGGVSGMQQLAGAAGAAATGMQATAAGATQAAGAVASVSGQYNGVINVANALKQTAGSSAELASNAGFAVEQLTSISGQASGVYRVNTAIKSTSATVSSAASGMLRLAQTIQSVISQYNKLATSAAKAANSLIPGMGITAPKRGGTDITGNTSGNSISSLPRYANGGSFRVGGQGGIDRNMVKFMATKGERVDVLTPAQQRAQAAMYQRGNSGNTINLYITTPDAESFQRSRRQISHELNLVAGAG